MKRTLWKWVLLVLGLAIAAPMESAEAVKPEIAAADQAWKDLLAASRPPAPPAEWGKKQPTAEEKEAFNKRIGQAALDAAAKAREFYTKYPQDSKVAEAQQREKRLLETAARYGREEAAKKLDENPAMTDEEKIRSKINQVNGNALKMRSKGLPAVMEEFEKGLRGLSKDYPDSPEVAAQYLTLAKNLPTERSREIYTEILAGKAPDEVKAEARKAMKVMGAIGQPLEIAFTAFDGKEIDIQKMKGKVVVVDFWATWCGPCIAELPKVKDLYAKYHAEGLEIVGISLDKHKAPFAEFLKKQEIAWPQYFDGEGWGNKFSIEYEVSSIPTVWIVDKKGLLRDLNGREDLEEKVKKFLAEK